MYIAAFMWKCRATEPLSRISRQSKAEVTVAEVEMASKQSERKAASVVVLYSSSSSCSSSSSSISRGNSRPIPAHHGVSADSPEQFSEKNLR